MPHTNETPSGHVSLSDREFTIGEWHVMPSRLELRAGDEIRTLRNMEMAVLVALAEANGAVLLKDDLVDRVWEGRFVQGQVLTNSIFELRRAFQDSAKEPKIIATVNRKGYRLIAEVSVLPIEATALSNPSKITHRPRVSRLQGAAAIIFLLAVLLGVWHSSQNEKYREQADLARALLDEQRYDEASQAAARAVAIRPTSEILDTQANLFDILGHKPRALKVIDQSIKRAKSTAERTKRKRRRAQILGNTTEERRLLQEGQLLDPEDHYWPFKLAWFYITHDRDCSKSLSHYARAYDLIEHQKSANLLSYYGEALMACGDYDLAEANLKEYKELRPSSAEPDDMLGTLYTLRGDFGKAASHFEAAISHPGAYPPSELNYALFLIRQNNFDAAIRRLHQYETRLQSGPNLDNQSAVALALVSLAEGLATGTTSHFDRALEEATRAIELREDDPRGHWVRGLAQVALRNLQGAEADLTSLRAHLGAEDRAWRVEYAAHLEAEIAAAHGDDELVARASAQCNDIPTSDLFLSQCEPTIHKTLRSFAIRRTRSAPKPASRTTRLAQKEEATAIALPTAD